MIDKNVCRKRNKSTPVVWLLNHHIPINFIERGYFKHNSLFVFFWCFLADILNETGVMISILKSLSFSQKVKAKLKSIFSKSLLLLHCRGSLTNYTFSSLTVRTILWRKLIYTSPNF